jgi:hypothetical protein
MRARRSSGDGTKPTAWVDVAAGSALSIVMGAVAGGIAGLVWGGVGGRIAMRVIFLASDDRVRGLTSDDGFEIGRFSFDTLVLLIGMTFIGAFLGGAYGFLRMFLEAPVWVLSVGMALTVGTVGGALVVNADGVDFRFLEPLSLAVTMFVALPAIWGATVPLVTERLLGIKRLFPERLVGVDAKPFGAVGSLIGWGVLLGLTILGVIDLVADLDRLT